MADAPRLTIIGLGLIGGSLGMAVRAAKLGYRVVGHDLRPETAGQAKKRGAVDQAEWNLPAAVETADLVVVATPPRAVEQVFKDVAPYLKPGCVVTDVASTKAQILRWADELLPEHVSFVGGHPLAEPEASARERSGIAGADATLFQDATWCMIPSARAAQNAVDRVSVMARAVGARPLFLDESEHDALVAAVSHLPFVASTALFNAVASTPAWTDLRRMAGATFRDATQSAADDPATHADVCLTNPEGLLRWIDALRSELDLVAQQIRDGDADALRETFASAKTARDLWTTPPAPPAPAKPLRFLPGRP